MCYFLVGDFFYSFVMMVSDVVFEVESVKDELINGFHCKGEGFTRGSKPSDSFYVNQSRSKHPTGEMKHVCRTFLKEDRSKQYGRVIPRAGSRQLNYVKNA